MTTRDLIFWLGGLCVGTFLVPPMAAFFRTFWRSLSRGEQR